MSTNYYALTNHCECCDRADELHIGQWAARRFLLAQHSADGERPALITWDDWMKWLESSGVKIRDEYHEIIGMDELRLLAEITMRTPSSDQYHEWQGPTYVAGLDQEFF